MTEHKSDEIDALRESLSDVLHNQKMPVVAKAVEEPAQPEEPPIELLNRRSPVREAFLASLRDTPEVKGARTLDDRFPLASTLVEYSMSSSGYDAQSISNAGRFASLEPPEIRNIQDLADTIDWRLVKKGVGIEHIETQISKDKKGILLFFDERIKNKLASVKEMLNTFGDVQIEQKADERNEDTKAPQGYYIISIKPYSIEDANVAKIASSDKPPSQDDLTIEKPRKTFESVDDEDERQAKEEAEQHLLSLVLEGHEPFCSTCGHHVALTEDEGIDRNRRIGQAGRALLNTGKSLAYNPVASHVSAYHIGYYKGREKAWEQHGGLAHRIAAGEAAYEKRKLKKVKDKLKTDSLQEASKDELAKHIERAARGGRYNLVRGTVLNPAVTHVAAGYVGHKVGYGSVLKDLIKRQKRLDRLAAAKRDEGLTFEVPEEFALLLEQIDQCTISCATCETPATKLNEHAHNGSFCARHGSALDRYSKVCYECESTIPTSAKKG